jgi:hypothetical protein
MYRSKKADELHQAILAYLRTKNRRLKKRVGHAVAALDREAILETSINGHSHMVDVLHLPFIMKEVKDPAVRSLFLFNKLSTKAKSLGEDVLPALLMKSDKTGNTPLHYAAYSNSTELLERVLSCLRTTLSQEDYKLALHCKDSSKRKPSCHSRKSNAQEINHQLNQERKALNLSDGAEKISPMPHSRKRQTPEPTRASRAEFKGSELAKAASTNHPASKKQRTVTTMSDGNLFVFFTPLAQKISPSSLPSNTPQPSLF